MEKSDAYKKAKEKVEEKIGFFIHLIVYVIVNALLIFINLNTVKENLWFKWPLIGWGIALMFHCLAVFVFSGTSNIKEKMIEKEMKKEASKK